MNYIWWIQYFPDTRTVCFYRRGLPASRKQGWHGPVTNASERRLVRVVENLVLLGKGCVLLPTHDDFSWVWVR